MGLTISLNRISFLPPPVRNNIFYEIETSSTGLYNTGLGVHPTGGGRSPFWRKTFKNDGKSVVYGCQGLLHFLSRDILNGFHFSRDLELMRKQLYYFSTS
jgi:hypothetical protein